MRRSIAAIVIALAGAACSDGGTAIRETVQPSPTASETSGELVTRSYPGFSLSVPSAWQESRTTVEEGRARVLHHDPAAGTPEKPRRAVDVIVEVIKLEDVRKGVVEVFSKRFKEYRQIGIVDDLTVDGHKAFRHEFTAEGLRYDQWWIERTGGTFRVTLWAPIEEYPAAGTLNNEIIATFRETGG